METKFARKCTKCDSGMNQGYVVNDGDEYYCSDECLHSEYTPTEYDELCEEDEAYWTEWCEDDIQFELIDGVLVEIDE